VAQGRARYRENFDIANEILGTRYGYRRPDGAFFLWLDMSQFGGGEAAAKTLWQDSGVKVLPGTYLARIEPDGSNPGQDHVRIALVGDAPTTREALTRLAVRLG
jgi:N-succinyldiaminopimelate aminotransferase